MPLHVAPEQKATLSSDAAEFLAKAEAIPMEAIQAVNLTRNMFQANENPIEQGLIDRFHLELEPGSFAGTPVLIIRPPVSNSKYAGKIMFNIHGGGFVLGTARERMGLMAAGELGITVYSVEYSLSPEVAYPVANEQCLSVYRELVSHFGSANIVGLSSSAGGQIMLSTMVRAQRAEMPLPACLVFYTPNIDLTGMGDSNIFNSGRDLIDNKVAVEAFKQLYAGGVDLKDELLSPIYAQLSGPLPPTVIITGTRDLLLSQCVRLYWKLRDAGGMAELLVSEGMWHGFTWEADLPEGIQARKAVWEFVRPLLD